MQRAHITVQALIYQSGLHHHFGTMLLMPCPFQLNPHPIAFCCVVEQTLRTNKPTRIDFLNIFLGLKGPRKILVLKSYVQKVALYLFGYNFCLKQYFCMLDFRILKLQQPLWFVCLVYLFNYLSSLVLIQLLSAELWRKELSGP